LGEIVKISHILFHCAVIFGGAGVATFLFASPLDSAIYLKYFITYSLLIAVLDLALFVVGQKPVDVE
jgi:hypothetical protein